MNLNSILAGLGVAAVVIASFFIGGWAKQETVTPVECDPSVVEDCTVGGQRAGLQEFADGILVGNKDSGPGVTSEWYSGQIAPGDSQATVFRNTSGKDIFAEFGAINVITGQTASSTYRIYAFATTTSAVASTNHYTALVAGKGDLIGGVSIATSTTATTTNSVYAARSNLGNGGVLVPNNSYFLVYLQAVDLGSCAGATAGMCEAATSTNRGFNPQYRVRIHY